MKSYFSDKTQIVKFKIVKQGENLAFRTINALFISSCCILAITSVYYFVSTHSIKMVFFFIGSFFLLSLFMEVLYEYFNVEYVEFRIISSNFIITKGTKVEMFDINKCKIKYHKDKTDWLELNCENQNFNFSLAQRQTSKLRNFIKETERNNRKTIGVRL